MAGRVHMRFKDRRALSNVLATLLILIIILLVTIPFLVYYTNTLDTISANSLVADNYMYLRDLQVSQVEAGNPALVYTGPWLVVLYNNVTYVSPANFVITGVLYLTSSGVWTNVTTLNYPIAISGDEVIPLPSSVQGKPIIVVTSLGNLFFLEPNSTIGPLSPGITNGFGVTIIGQVQTANGPEIINLTVVSNVTGSQFTYSTPVLLNYTTPHFYVQAPLSVSVQPLGDLEFKNWVVIGNANYAVYNSNTNSTIYVNMLGRTVVVIANYTQVSTA